MERITGKNYLIYKSTFNLLNLIFIEILLWSQWEMSVFPLKPDLIY